MIKNHRAGRAGAGGSAEAEGAFTGVAAVAAVVNVALPKTDVAADDVVLSVKGNFRAHDADAAAWSRLPGNGQAAAATDRRQQIDVTADIKNNDAVAAADGGAK